MDVFNGVTNETIVFTIVMFVGIAISMTIAYRDGYKSGKQIGMHYGYTKRFREERYIDKPQVPPSQKKSGVVKPPEAPQPIPNRRKKKNRQ